MIDDGFHLLIIQAKQLYSSTLHSIEMLYSRLEHRNLSGGENFPGPRFFAKVLIVLQNKSNNNKNNNNNIDLAFQIMLA